MKLFKSQVFAWVLSLLLIAPYGFASEIGTVTYVEGRVEVLKPNEEAARPLREDETVSVGDIIRTKTNSKAELSFKDKSKLRLAHSTKIQISDYQLTDKNKRIEATILLDRGKVRALVKKTKNADFNIHTPNANGAIKGSDIFAFYQAGSSGMLVSSGRLSVGTPNAPQIAPITVAPGSSILIPQNGVPQEPRTFLELEKEFHQNDTDPPAHAKRKKNLDIIEGAVTKISGEVSITPKGEKKSHQLVINEIVRTGDTIITGDDGMVELKFDNGNSLSLKPNTHLVIVKLVVDPKTKKFENLFEVNMGKVKAVVEKIEGGSSFKIKTPQATSGVRGTIMYLVVSSILTESFFEGGPGFIESLFSGVLQDVGVGESASADNLGNVSDPIPVSGADREDFSGGFEPGGDTEGFSSSGGFLYEGDLGTDAGTGGVGDPGSTDSDNSVDVPITESNTSLLLASAEAILAALPDFAIVNQTVTPRLRIADFDDGTLQGLSKVAPFKGDLLVALEGGNPDGYMYAVDTDLGRKLFVRLPDTVLDIFDESNGLLWDEYIFDNGETTDRKVSIIVQGNGNTRYRSERDFDKMVDVWFKRYLNFDNPDEWTRFQGGSSFEDVISNLNGIFFSMETSTGSNNIFESGIDNVTLLLNEDYNILVQSLAGDITRNTAGDSGTYSLVANGTYGEELPSGWQIVGLSGNTSGENGFVGGSWLAGINGGEWSEDGSFGGVFNGIWVELGSDGALSGRSMSGDVLGEYIDVDASGTWTAASSGGWVEVGQLDLTGYNDDLIAMGTPIIPITEVYSSILAGPGAFAAGGTITVNNIFLDFFASDILALNGIWGASVAGDFTAPTSDAWSANVSGNLIDSLSNDVVGSVDAVMTGSQWNSGNWQASVEGSTDTGISLSGQSAGTYNDGAGTFTGGGVGTWEQGP